MSTNPLKEAFDRDGYVVVKEFLTASQAGMIKDIAARDEVMAEHAHERLDAAGRKSRLTLWYEPGDDVFGRLSTSDRMMEMMSACLGGEACFFHAKLMQKEPHQGGAWEWHQDYGYWYDDGFLTDNLASCYVALDGAVRANGCLMVLPGTHHYGRLRHGHIGEQTGADPERVAALQARHAPVYVELAPGDAVFFHANLLHASNPNLSDFSRWGLISCFFRDDNESVLADARFRKKDIVPTRHETILDGAGRSDASKSFL